MKKDTPTRIIDYLLDIQIMIVMNLLTLILTSVRFDKTLTFVITLMIGLLFWVLFLFMSKMTQTGAIVYVVATWYYWIVHSYVAILLDDFVAITDWVLDLVIFVFYLIVMLLLQSNRIYETWNRYVSLHIILLFFTAAPVFDHNAFMDITTSLIKMVILIIIYSVLQYKEIKGKKYGTKIVPQIYYIFFSSLIPLFLLFVIHVCVMLSATKRSTFDEVVQIQVIEPAVKKPNGRGGKVPAKTPKPAPIRGKSESHIRDAISDINTDPFEV